MMSNYLSTAQPFVMAIRNRTCHNTFPGLHRCCSLTPLQVILIHLSNITGLHNNYNKRTMTLLISDVGTIVAGITSAFATGPAKVEILLLAALEVVMSS